MELGNTKNEQIFGGAFRELLSEIDDLSKEVADTLQGIIVTHGVHAYRFNERRTNNIGILIDENFLVDVTDPRYVLDKKYSRDTLFMELSKRQYNISPNTSTTKQQMIDWILENSEELKRKLVFKYAILNYSKKLEQYIKELEELIRELNVRNPYRAERILLSDFYDMLEEEKQNSDDNIGERLERWSNESSKKKKSVALLLCIFGGYIGLHYFYVGKIGMGILYFFTVGLFGIGWLVDIARVAAGKFKDRHEHYLK